MGNRRLKFDLGESVRAFELVLEARLDRRRATEVLQLETAPPDARLAEVFAAIDGHLARGLTLTAAAALAGCSRPTLAVWVLLGDQKREPWHQWVSDISKRAALRRLDVLDDLRKLGEVDKTSQRTYLLELNRASAFEHELAGLRRLKGAKLGALMMPSSAVRNAPQVARDSQSVGEPSKTSDLLSELHTSPGDAPVQKGPGGEP